MTQDQGGCDGARRSAGGTWKHSPGVNPSDRVRLCRCHTALARDRGCGPRATGITQLSNPQLPSAVASHGNHSLLFKACTTVLQALSWSRNVTGQRSALTTLTTSAPHTHED